MSITPVQKYLNLATSLLVSNKSGTDTTFRLSDDYRKIQDQKVRDIDIESYPQGAFIHSGPSVAQQIVKGLKSYDPCLVFVFFSHPVSIEEINGQALAQAFNTSFYGVYRDRAGGSVGINSPGANNNLLKFHNNLSTSSNYTTVVDASNAGASVEINVVRVYFE